MLDIPCVKVLLVLVITPTLGIAGIQFSPHVLQLLRQQDNKTSEYVDQTHTNTVMHQTIKQQSDSSCSEWAKKADIAINIAAVVYAAAKIYHCYSMVSPAKPTRLQTWWLAACPAWMHALTKQGSFFIDSIGCILETLVYKTIAKCVVACGTHDIVDVTEIALERSKQVATKIAW